MRQPPRGAQDLTSQSEDLLNALQAEQQTPEDPARPQDDIGTSETLTQVKAASGPKHPTVEDLASGTKNPRKPRPGACVYMLINIKVPVTAIEYAIVFSELELANKNTDFFVTITEDGEHLLVLGGHERANNALQGIASSIKKACPQMRTAIGAAKVEQDGLVNFKIDGVAPLATNDAWKGKKGTFVTKEFAAIVQDGDSREGTLCELVLGDEDPETGLVEVLSYKPKVSKKIGGPDRLIGNKDKLTKLTEAVKDQKKRLIYIQGPAGIGKTRLLLETLANTGVPYVHCSLDAGDKNQPRPGASLVTLANQLGALMDENSEIQGLLSGTDTKDTLAEFYTKPQSEQIEMAETDPKKLSEMCLSGLSLLNFVKGSSTVFILEDFHHADRHSQPWLKNIVSKYLKLEKGKDSDEESKAIVTMREDEVYEFEAQKQLKRDTKTFCGETSFDEIKLDGIDFANGVDPETGEDLSYQYAFYSLDPKLRAGKVLGEWHKTLGKAAGRVPLTMTSFMQVAKTNLEVGERVIGLKRETVDKIATIKPGDPNAISIHYRQRINALSEKSCGILQAIALIGGKISIINMRLLMEKMTGREFHDSDATIAIAQTLTELTDGGYLETETDSKSGGVKAYAIKNDTMKEFAVKSMSPVQARIYAGYVYGILAMSTQESASETKLSVMNYLANDEQASELEESFWDEYSQTAISVFKKAEDENNIGKAYDKASKILDSEEGCKVLQATIKELQKPEAERSEQAIPESLKQLAVNTLLTLAKNALFLARFDEAEAAVRTLEEIEAANSGLVSIQTIALIQYEIAYQKLDVRFMKTVYGDDIGKEDVDLPQSTKVVAKLKLDYRRRDYQSLYSTYTDNLSILESTNEEHKSSHKGMPSPDFIEAKRLVTVMAPFDEFKQAVKTIDETHVLDDDQDYKGELVPEALRPRLAQIAISLAELETEKANFPTIFNPFSELYLLGIKAEILAYSGNRTQALDLALDSWAVAEQMQIPNLGAQYAQMIGDLNIQMGFPEKALDAYNKQGAISTENLLDNNFFKWAMRIQRLRAVAQICIKENAKGELPEPRATQRKEKLEIVLAQGFAEFEELNKLSAKKAPALHEDPQVAYYGAGYIAYLLQVAAKFKIPYPKDLNQETKYPFLSTETLKSASAYGETVRDSHEAAPKAATPPTPQKIGINQPAALKRAGIKTIMALRQKAVAMPRSKA